MNKSKKKESVSQDIELMRILEPDSNNKPIKLNVTDKIKKMNLFAKKIDIFLNLIFSVS